MEKYLVPFVRRVPLSEARNAGIFMSLEMGPRLGLRWWNIGITLWKHSIPLQASFRRILATVRQFPRLDLQNCSRQTLELPSEDEWRLACFDFNECLSECYQSDANDWIMLEVCEITMLHPVILPSCPIECQRSPDGKGSNPIYFPNPKTVSYEWDFLDGILFANVRSSNIKLILGRDSFDKRSLLIEVTYAF
jgi:hypothetical protein